MKNQGLEPVYSVVVLDTPGTGLAIPGGASDTNATQSVNSSESNSRAVTYSGAGTGEFTVDQLNAGESVTFTVVVI